MSWRDLLFWKRPPVADLDALSTFVDERAAFLVQKGIYEYSRARAGHYAKVLFHESEFNEALDRSRWRAYPLGLAMVGEVLEAALRPHAGEDAARHADRVRLFVLSVFDRYPPPEALGAEAWREERTGLDRHLRLLGVSPPKRVIDMPEPYARIYWDLMPIAKEVRSRDFPTTHSYLKIMLCNIHEELTRRADLPTLARRLREEGSPSPPGSGQPEDAGERAARP
jgi:hypothetical protein